MKRLVLVVALVLLPVSFVVAPASALALDAGMSVNIADAGTADAGTLMTADAGEAVAAAEGAPTAKPPDIDSDFTGFLKAVHAAAMGKEWGKLLFFIITLLVWASRKFLGSKLPWLQSSVAAVVKTFLLAFSGALATTWGAGMKPTVADIFTAVNYGFAAAGGWSILKAMVEAAAKKWEWAKWLLNLLMPASKA